MRTGIILHPENFSKKCDIDNELGLTSAIIQKNVLTIFKTKIFEENHPLQNRPIRALETPTRFRPRPRQRRPETSSSQTVAKTHLEREDLFHKTTSK